VKVLGTKIIFGGGGGEEGRGRGWWMGLGGKGGGGEMCIRSFVVRIRRCVARGSVSEVFPDYQ
jgi:hypothetical protein